jgi:hypothetical protein
MNEKGIRKTISVLTALFITMSVLPACQKTPDKPIVVNKGDNKLIEKIEGSNSEALAPSGFSSPEASRTANAVATLGAPAHVLDSFTGVDGKIVVNVDADVFLPDASAIPVVKMAPGKFTQEQVDAMVAWFMQGKPLYKQGKEMSKKDIQAEIIRLKAELTKNEDERERSQIQANIGQLEEELKTAPDASQADLSSGKLETVNRNGESCETLNVSADLGKKRDAHLFVLNDSDGRGSYAEFSNMDANIVMERNYIGKPRGMRMELQDARALAEKTVAGLGAELTLAQTGAVCLDYSTAGEESDDSPDPDAMPQAYVFYFMRSVAGVPTTYTEDECASLTSMEDNYTKPWRYEKMRVVVDDTGVADFEWVSPMRVLDTMTGNVQMLPWDEIYGVFTKMIVTSNAWAVSKESGNTKCTFTVARITLGLSRISAKDRPDEYMLVPVWDFIGYHTIENPRMSQADMAEQAKNMSAMLGMSTLTINAVDGSIIDRGFGY